MKKLSILCVILIFVFSGNAFAAEPVPAVENGGMAAAALPAFTHEHMKAMALMHDDMMRGVMDPDPDAAFAKGMLPHHKGAVEMAKVELRYGKDPELRKLAEEIIAAQQKEILLMDAWIKRYEDRRIDITAEAEPATR